jgi:hypothetical protein
VRHLRPSRLSWQDMAPVFDLALKQHGELAGGGDLEWGWVGWGGGWGAVTLWEVHSVVTLPCHVRL